MHASIPVRLVVGGLCGLILLGGSDSADAQTKSSLLRGRELFFHVWSRCEGRGDGLGPLYNASSCVGCHFQKGAGGAGPNERNVEVLAPLVRKNLVEARLAPAWLARFHPGFNAASIVVLHRFGTSADYAPFRESLLANELEFDHPSREVFAARGLARHHVPVPIKQIRIGANTDFVVCQRSTTPMFGIGLIDRIPAKVLDEVARSQPHEDSQVSGRRAGRFGWRGQVDTLREFVLGACAVELGLEVPKHHQASEPQRFLLEENTQPRSRPLDLSLAQCNDLIVYVSQLPPPRAVRALDQTSLAEVDRGEARFTSLGCNVCHRPTLGHVPGVYSDLLMHDMGELLEDPASASTSPRTFYYGSGDFTSPLAAERRREWKTPPLWGLRDSGPYLHDGRAPTIENAILWHSGEASGSLDRYLLLTPNERSELLAFLSTLAAPAKTDAVDVSALPINEAEMAALARAHATRGE